jgi:hypothetical protein
MSGSSAIVGFLVGWGILRLVALVPFLGGLASLAAAVVGLGAIVVAGRRARSADRVVPEPREPMPTAPPTATPTAPPRAPPA